MAASNPPKMADRFLGWFVKGDLLEEILGDLYEYHQELSELPVWKRNTFYWFHVFHFIRPSLLKNLTGKNKLNYLGMIHLLFKLSIRQMRKKQLITVISLVTLIVGVLSFQLTLSWVQNELSMDDFHEKRDRIHIGVTRLSPESNIIAFSLSGIFRLDYTNYPEIEESIFIHTYMPGEIHFNANGVSHTGKGLVTDSTFLEVFDFDIKKGAPDALYNPTNILITENYGKKVFGDADPVGKFVEINCDQEGTYQVAGILENIPSISSLTFDFLVPRHSKDFWRRAPQDIILLSEGVELETVNEKFKLIGEQSERFPESEAFLFPFQNVYEDKPFNISLFAKYGNAGNLKTATLITWALLLIMVICYTNLQTSVQLSEMDKVKLKHVIGAAKGHLITEWLVRGFIYFLIAGGLSIILYFTCFDTLVDFIGLELDMQPVRDTFVILSAILMSVTLSAIIASTNVFKTLRDLDVRKEKPIHAIGQPRKVLAIIQYSITIMLLIGTAIVTLQLRYLLDKELGINQSEIVSVRFFDVIPSARQDSLKRIEVENRHDFVINRLRQYDNILAVSKGRAPLDFAYDLPFKLASSADDFTPIMTLNTDPGFDDVFGLSLMEGRMFNENEGNDDQTVLINESAKKFFKIDDINDANLIYKVENRDHKVVGVVEDFHFEHLSQEIKPLILTNFTRLDNDIIVRYKKGSDKETLEFLEGLFREVNPEGIFTANFFEDKVAEQYAKEEKVGRIYSIFGAIAILLSSVTLFSFVYHETNRRTKEVGVRKVNGATQADIFKLFGYSFMRSILLALILSIPIGWYAMEQWLSNFSNRINQEFWMYVLVGMMVIVWALIAIIWHTSKVARINPVESLRYE